MPTSVPDGVTPDSPDFFAAFAANLEAHADTLTNLARHVAASTEVEVSNRVARMRLNGAQIVDFEFTEAAESVAKSGLAAQVMDLYREGQARLAQQNSQVLAGQGIDLLSAMPESIRERSEDIE
ncbi:MAG: hypothetical protein GXX86_09265 [Propionibacterium sp.]|nr:hypothetical protein [Propionibacterium sp.]